MITSLPNVVLRAMEPEDLDLLYSIENDTEVWKVGSNNVPYSRYMLHDYIANSTGDIYADKQLRLIIENEKKQTVGIVDLANFDPCNLRAEVGIAIHQNYRGRGYADATLESLISYVDRRLHLHQLYVIIDVNNKQSVQIFKKAGFKGETVIKDWLIVDKEYHDVLFMQLFL